MKRGNEKNSMKLQMNSSFLMLAAAAALTACGGGGGGGGTTGGTSGDGAVEGGTPAPADSGSGGTTGGTMPDSAVAPIDAAAVVDAAVVDAAVADAAVDAAAADASVDVLCTPCDTDDDCSGGTCLDFGGANACTVHCSDAAQCGDGYTCAARDGTDGMVCVPAEGACAVAPPPCVDGDGDGYGQGASCLGTDCDDGDGAVHPGVADPCDGADNDCDGTTDEDFVPQTCGVGVCGSASTCAGGVEQPCLENAPTGDDADCDGLDNNCNGQVDEGYAPQSCGLGACAAQSQCADGVEQPCVPGALLAPEDVTCDGVDDDCNGEVDEDYVGDACGNGACAVRASCVDAQPVCEPLAPQSPDDTTCNGVDENCDGRIDEGWQSGSSCGVGVCERQEVCDPAQGGAICAPGAPLTDNDATCDGLDDNCNGLIDEDCGDNNLGFQVIRRDAATMDVAVEYAQEFSPVADPAGTQPRLMNLRIQYSDNLALIADDPNTDMDDRVTPGAAIVAAEKDLTIFEPAPNVLRLTILSVANTTRIEPGEVVVMHFQILNGAAPPHLHWIPIDPVLNLPGTSMAPQEAMNVMTLSDADL